MEDATKKNIVTRVHSYLMSQAVGSGSLPPPRELVEVDLMERFHWTPDQISAISDDKIEEIYLVLKQRDASRQAAESAALTRPGFIKTGCTCCHKEGS